MNARMSSPPRRPLPLRSTEIRRQLAALPSPDDKIVLFDRFRSEVRSFPETVDAASDEKRRELVSLLVERVETAERPARGPGGLDGPAGPFFKAAAAEQALWMAPPDGFEPPTPALGRLRSIH